MAFLLDQMGVTLLPSRRTFDRDLRHCNHPPKTFAAASLAFRPKALTSLLGITRAFFSNAAIRRTGVPARRQFARKAILRSRL